MSATKVAAPVTCFPAAKCGTASPAGAELKGRRRRKRRRRGGRGGGKEGGEEGGGYAVLMWLLEGLHSLMGGEGHGRGSGEIGRETESNRRSIE